MDQFEAAKKGDLQRVKELVNHGNINEKGPIWTTALHKACEGGHASVVEWLIGMGADVEARDAYDWTPLWSAACCGYASCLKLLLDRSGDASMPGLLHAVAGYEYGRVECVALLIAAHPGDIHVVDWRGSTPLHSAVIGSAEACRVLLDAGSVVDSIDTNGCTPLYLALLVDSRRVTAELLLDRGAQLNRVKLDDRLREIPHWALSFVTCRDACRLACRAILQLQRRHSGAIGANGRDVLHLVAVFIWESRCHPAWEASNCVKQAKLG
jgi:hypothetical protein